MPSRKNSKLKGPKMGILACSTLKEKASVAGAEEMWGRVEDEVSMRQKPDLGKPSRPEGENRCSSGCEWEVLKRSEVVECCI